MKLVGIGSMLLALTASACGGAAVPQDKLATAQAAIRAAEVGGAPSEPQAALLVKKAQDQVAQAKAEIEEGNNEEAAMTLTRAETDAELALYLAQERTMKLEADKARQQVEQLKAKLPKR